MWTLKNLSSLFFFRFLASFWNLELSSRVSFPRRRDSSGWKTQASVATYEKQIQLKTFKYLQMSTSSYWTFSLFMRYSIHYLIKHQLKKVQVAITCPRMWHWISLWVNKKRRLWNKTYQILVWTLLLIQCCLLEHQ